MDTSTIVAWVFLVLGFLAFSLSLWGVGVNQPRELTDEEIANGQIGNERLYKVSLAFIFIGLFIYVLSTTYLGYKAGEKAGLSLKQVSRPLVPRPSPVPVRSPTTLSRPGPLLARSPSVTSVNA